MGDKRSLNKLKSLDPAVKAGFWFTVCNVLQRGIQFIVTPIYTRILTTSQYGQYSLFTSWMNILMIFGSLNLSAGIYYNGLIKDDKDVDSYTSSLEILGFISTFFTLAITLLINNFFPKLLDMRVGLILCMFAYILVYPAMGFWSAQKRVLYAYKPVIAVTLLASIIAPLIGIPLVYFYNLGADGLIYGFVGTNVAINSVACIRILIKGKFKVSIKDWKEALSFSLPLIPHYLSQVVLAQFDRIMINIYCGEAKAGIYTLAYQVGLVLSIVTNGINSVFTPWMYQRLKEKNYREIRKVTNYLFLFILMINILLVLIAPEIIAILGTKEYSEAVWIIPPVLLSSFITFVYCSFGTVLFYYEDTKQAAFATTAGAVADVILNAAFIPIFGYIAAGYTTFVSYIIILALYYFFTKKCCKQHEIKNIFDIKKIIYMIIFMLVLSLVFMSIYRFIIIRYLVIGALIVAIIKKRKFFASLFNLLK